MQDSTKLPSQVANDTIYGLKKLTLKTKKMKKVLFFIAVIAIITGCSKKEANTDNPVDIWNGYQNLKYSTITVDLFAGQHIDVGSVTFVITEDVDEDGNYSETAYFQATYNLVDGWEMSESHVYAGGLEDIPVNKPGAPKIGKFPYKSDHNPKVTTYTYSIPVMSLPAYDDGEEDNFIGGFVVAAHCVVSHPNQGQETGWADCNHSFSDKGWGSYMDDYFSEAIDIDVLYGLEQDGTDLNVIHINTLNGDGNVIFTESISDNSGSLSSAAYDEDNQILYYVIGNILYANNLSNDSGTDEIATLSGTPTGGSFYQGVYYYFDSSSNSIMMVSDNNGTWTISNLNVAFPDEFAGILISDITISPTTGIMYLIGQDGSLISFNLSDLTYYTSAISTGLSGSTQIAAASDGTLYAIEDGNTTLLNIDPNNGNTGEANTGGDDDQIIIDPGIKTLVGKAKL